MCVCVCNFNERKLNRQLLCHYRFISTNRRYDLFHQMPFYRMKRDTKTLIFREKYNQIKNSLPNTFCR